MKMIVLGSLINHFNDLVKSEYHYYSRNPKLTVIKLMLEILFKQIRGENSSRNISESTFLGLNPKLPFLNPPKAAGRSWRTFLNSMLCSMAGLWIVTDHIICLHYFDFAVILGTSAFLNATKSRKNLKL